MSHAASAQYPVQCPTCNAKIKEPCRTLESGRVTDTHVARQNLWRATQIARRHGR